MSSIALTHLHKAFLAKHSQGTSLLKGIEESEAWQFGGFSPCQKFPGLFTETFRGFFVSSSYISVYSPIAFPSFYYNKRAGSRGLCFRAIAVKHDDSASAAHQKRGWKGIFFSCWDGSLKDNFGKSLDTFCQLLGHSRSFFLGGRFLSP